MLPTSQIFHHIPEFAFVLYKATRFKIRKSSSFVSVLSLQLLKNFLVKRSFFKIENGKKSCNIDIMKRKIIKNKGTYQWQKVYKKCHNLMKINQNININLENVKNLINYNHKAYEYWREAVKILASHESMQYNGCWCKILTNW